MTRNWNDIKWIFEPDGSLRDIYVQDVTLSDWEKLIDFLILNYDIKFGEDEKKQIDKEYVIEYLRDETGEMESKSLKIDFNGVNIHCYFFLPNQIEFDIDPKEITAIKDFETIEKFMTSISQTLRNQVTLTGENSPEFPLFKIDFDKNVNKVLTEKEAEELSNRQSSILTELNVMKTRLMMRFFPKKFESKVLKSANEPYRPTGKDKNVW
ncbi:hypothetical protein [Telluribacter sp.]|jgi:hypothetical protein|uniref:hypothetical protein n=1 Tax=Telluribacter sp. TaxID=1978767 RepID=UPI002E0F6F3E|nr:hypothetical protein [Telluribacter sp.]